MSFFSGLGLGVQAKTEKVVNEVVANFSNEAINECVTNAKNQFNTLIERSNVKIAGNLEVQQKARLVLACIQKQDNSAELIQKLQTEIKTALGQQVKNEALASLASIGVQITDTEFDQKIENSVTIDTANICKANVENLASITVRDSNVTLGCSAEEIAQAAATCQAAMDQVATLTNNAQEFAAKALQAKSAAGEEQFLKLAQQANENADKALAAARSPDGPCAAQNECARKQSSILVNQDAELQGECNQAQTIAAKLATEVDTLSRTELDQVVASGMSPLTLLAIIGGALLGLVVLAVIIFAVARAARKKKQSKGFQQYPGPAYGSAAAYPAGAMMAGSGGAGFDQFGQPVYPQTGTAFDASMAPSAASFY